METRHTPSNKLVIGLLAHVDAGKTTLAEAILYRCGNIRRPGRVDHGNAHLDTHELERARGITIFSKQAVFELEGREITLLDTPGHVDFSAEMERTLSVLDYAILVISGADGVQGHVRTLWRLLGRYRIPVFLFVNKMDQAGTDRDQILKELKEKLGDRCIDFSPDREGEAWREELAVCSEELLEAYLERGELSEAEIGGQIAKRQVFPCYFGSALKMEGVDEFLRDLARYMRPSRYPAEFGARVYKISRDEQGNRLTHLKITGGCLKVKMPLQGRDRGEEWEEKTDQIRIYSGSSYEAVPQAEAGSVCAVTGLLHTRAGEGMGIEGMGGEIGRAHV